MNNQNSLLSALQTSHERALALVSSLHNSQLDVPYLPGINPPVWELGHAAFFYERFILQDLDGAAPYNPQLNEIWDSFELAHEDRWTPGLFPNRENSIAYVQHIYSLIKTRIASKPLTDADLYLYKYTLFHLNMHIESMVWCRQSLGYQAPPGVHVPKGPESAGCGSNAMATALGDALVPTGCYRIGMPAQSPAYAQEDFAFDNEKPGFVVDMPAFRISKTLVSNGEFLGFVQAGGYQNDALWGMAALKWRNSTGAQHPLYWKREGDQWFERIFDQWHPLDPSRPARHISYWEAQAYCTFAGRRLPTELEWEVAALGNREDGEFRRYPWGNTLGDGQFDMDCTHMACLPVDALPQGDSPFGCRQMLGSVWEWTSSLFFPYDGFKVDMYPFMSTLQFATHRVARGGSCATSSILIRGTYRQAYMPDRNDVFAGFRTCALDPA